MNDEKPSEKEIFEDLDKMYQRVADIEKEEVSAVSVHKKERPKPKEKRSSRPIIIVALIVCIILAGILAFPFLKETISPQLTKTSKTPPPSGDIPPVPKAKPPVPPPVSKEQEPLKTIPKEVKKTKPVPPTPLPIPKEQETMKIPPKEAEKTKSISPTPPPIPKEQEAKKILPKEPEKTKPIPQEIAKPAKPSDREYYTIQTGAFHNLEYARDLLEILKKNGLDAYLTRIEGKKRGTFYKVFVGHFKDEKEGTRFLKEKKILNDYPGSFVRKEPSFEIHQLIEGKLTM